MSTNLGTDKDVEKVARKARKAGWEVAVTKGNHVLWVAPDGTRFLTSLTGSTRAARITCRTILRHLEGRAA